MRMLLLLLLLLLPIYLLFTLADHEARRLLARSCVAPELKIGRSWALESFVVETTYAIMFYLSAVFGGGTL
ncbi:predicted protein [Plenodomus lingam JN3]|uniref:Predicted protein n=1 Tax=Leptosphaeria maculans (strain JN3 / isolate v23.1.3 / race Av1-4-5-6-7-8) TaxID=985895 RepID=E5A3Z8_LEPMJ|nr:predicted protein [Plenodomus lingam JN3]CBX98343.1 predicted protein [Plenodomus lingam JN3]